MGDEYAGFGRIVYAVGRVDKFAHLQQSSPHSALSTCNGSPALAVVEQLVHDDGTSETK